jgi:hypothetical protein
VDLGRPWWGTEAPGRGYGGSAAPSGEIHDGEGAWWRGAAGAGDTVRGICELTVYLDRGWAVGAVRGICELTVYLDSDNMAAYEDDFDILNWWHEHKLTHPILSIMARDIMSVPASTTSLESTFSLSGRILEDRRRRLNSETVEMLVCIKDWELGQQRAQHAVVDNELEESFKDLWLDEGAGATDTLV